MITNKNNDNYFDDNNTNDNLINESKKLYKQIIGFFIIYIFFITIIPYFLIKYSYFSLFLTYFANIDIIANVLSVNFPSYFKKFYNTSPINIYQNISFNTISLIALSGIFIHGISQKNKGINDFNILSTMIIMSIITWTMPTQLIPYITDKIINRYSVKNTELSVLITTLVSLSFIIVEFFVIHLYINNLHNFRIHKYLRNIHLEF